MQQKTEAQVLAEAYESARQLTRWYISKMKGVDMKKEFEAGGMKLNSAYWIVAHLMWAEHALLLVALGGKPLNIPWLERFGLGSQYQPDENNPDFKQMLEQWKEIHAAAMAHVRALPDEILSKENPTGFGFGGDNSYRMMIQHSIRHEGVHAGHLSWLCKLHGIDTI